MAYITFARLIIQLSKEYSKIRVELDIEYPEVHIYLDDQSQKKITYAFDKKAITDWSNDFVIDSMVTL